MHVTASPDQWDISNGFAVQFLTLESKPSFTKDRGHAVNYYIHFSSVFTVCPSFTRGLSYQSCKTKLMKFHEFVVHITCISDQPGLDCASSFFFKNIYIIKEGNRIQNCYINLFILYILTCKLIREVTHLLWLICIWRMISCI